MARSKFTSGRGSAPSATKRGPGRHHKGGQPGTRITKQRPTRAYVALMASWAQKRLVNWKGQRDERGAAIVQVGRNPDGTRRTWVAGVSAQRVG